MEPTQEGAWLVYIVQCCDGTLYTGCTTDLERRLNEHNGDGGKGARYTRSRQPVAMVYSEAHDCRANALRREIAIKRMSRAQKLALCAGQSGDVPA